MMPPLYPVLFSSNQTMVDILLMILMITIKPPIAPPPGPVKCSRTWIVTNKDRTNLNLYMALRFVSCKNRLLPLGVNRESEYHYNDIANTGRLNILMGAHV